MKTFLLITVLILAGCSSAPRTPEQTAYAGTATFVGGLKAANAYVALPRCSATVKPPCSDQVIVNKIVAQANRTDIAVVAAQKVANDTTVSATDRQKAITAADDAMTALAAIIPQPQ